MSCLFLSGVEGEHASEIRRALGAAVDNSWQSCGKPVIAPLMEDRESALEMGLEGVEGLLRRHDRVEFERDEVLPGLGPNL